MGLKMGEKYHRVWHCPITGKAFPGKLDKNGIVVRANSDAKFRHVAPDGIVEPHPNEKKDVEVNSSRKK